MLDLQRARAFGRDEIDGRAAQEHAGVAEVERAQFAAARAVDAGSKFRDRGDQAADEFGLVALFGIRMPAGDQPAAAAFQKQQAPQHRALRIGERQFAHRPPRHDRLEAQLPVARGQATVQPLVQVGDEIAEGVGDGGGDEATRDRVERLDHHVFRILDLAADRRHHDRRDRGCEFSMPRDFRAAKRIHQDFRGRRFQPVLVADEGIDRIDARLQGAEPVRLGTQQQLLEAVQFDARLAGGAGHLSGPSRPSPAP